MNGNVLKEPVIISIAEKLGKTPAQVALRWNIQMGHSVLPKSTNEERIKQTLDVYDCSIPDDFLAKFSEIKQVYMRVIPLQYINEDKLHWYLLIIIRHIYRIS
jgi:diketogulonate reductase-like aldo/keto reductase